MLGVAALQFRRPSAARVLFWWQRLFARSPHRGVGQNAGNVRQVERGDAGAQIGAGTVTSVHQDDTARQTGLTGPAELFESDFWLGLEADVIGPAGLVPPCFVVRP